MVIVEDRKASIPLLLFRILDMRNYGLRVAVGNMVLDKTDMSMTTERRWSACVFRRGRLWLNGILQAAGECS